LNAEKSRQCHQNLYFEARPTRGGTGKHPASYPKEYRYSCSEAPTRPQPPPNLHPALPSPHAQSPIPSPNPMATDPFQSPIFPLGRPPCASQLSWPCLPPRTPPPSNASRSPTRPAIRPRRQNAVPSSAPSTSPLAPYGKLVSTSLLGSISLAWLSMESIIPKP